jgi:hypothetical protein
MSTGTDGSGGWGKWYVAIGVGATVTAAAATGYLIWMSRKGKDGGQAPLSPQRANGDISRSDITGEETSGPPPLEQPDPPHPPSPTPLEQARAVKARGNGLFKEKKYREAIECYQEAIECCPDSETEDLAMFYHNIAACYESMVSNHTSINPLILSFIHTPTIPSIHTSAIPSVHKSTIPSIHIPTNSYIH